jgi:hypothetical protein
MSSNGRKEVDGQETHHIRARRTEGDAEGHEGEEVVLAKIAQMSDSDCAMAERVHAIVMKAAPGLTPRTWYGMPAYAKDGKIVCFFQDAAKFKARYATIGFSDKANLGNMWATAFALTKLTKAEEKRIVELVKQAASWKRR